MNRKRDVRAMIVLLVVLVAGLFLGNWQRADAMVPEDILAMRSVALLDVAPDGAFLLYGVGAWDESGRENLVTIFRRDLATGRDQLLFTPAEGARGPVVRPDGGAIAYVRGGESGDELWLMDTQGGERRLVAVVPGGLGALHWSPAGDALAWIAPRDGGDYEGETGHRVVADDLAYRHLGAGYREGRLDALHVIELADGAVRRIAGGPDAEPALDVRACSWSPDGTRLVFAAKRRADLGWNLNQDLWLVGRGGGEPGLLTTNPGEDASPVWHRPDRIAYTRATDPLWESAPRTVAELDPATGEVGGLTLHGADFGDWFRNFVMIDGVPHVLGARRGCLDLVRFGPDGPQVLTGGGHDFWSLKAAGRQVFLQGAGQTLPGAVFQVDLAEKRMPPHRARIVVDPNRDWRQRVGLVEPERFSLKVAGREIEGWIFMPEHVAPGQKVPTVLSIHGGPEWMYGGYFLPEFHILPRFGYAVVICNPTGSMGYGTAFMADVQGDWTGRPAREVLAVLDAMVDRGWADPERLALMGGSYGGFLGAALTTQTDRFAAAALDRMFGDAETFWGTTDEKWFPEWEFGGRPWDPQAVETYARNSPFARVGQVTTPTLLSHGLRDYRCLAAGPEMWFSALQARGVPSRFLRFESEGHGIRRADNQVFYANQLLNWFDEHVLGPVGPEGVAGDDPPGRHD
ncbi:S9 family peptidase [bacterium]|nr:S9 family peptidase [bacterium]